MRYALISDLHANLQATGAVLDAIEGLDVDRILCLGDVVGYGGDPARCIDLVRRFCSHVILGNHDAGAADRTSTAYFNHAAREALAWTTGNLSEKDIRWLAGLPYTREFDELAIVHSSPDDPGSWRYLHSRYAAAPQFDHTAHRLLFFGHTHVPVVFRQGPDGAVSGDCQPELDLEEGCRYLVNVGSVGQPRDGDPRACFALLDTDRERIVYQRVEYDIGAAQGSIRDKGLPAALADRLALGR